MAKERTITRRMNTVLDDLESEFKIIYSEDDFKRKIKIYEKKIEQLKKRKMEEKK